MRPGVRSVLTAIIDYLNQKAPWIWAMVASLAARLMYHTEQAKRGRRRFFSVKLAYELPTAVGMAIIAYGGCLLFGFTGEGAVAIVGVASYLGPYTIDIYVTRWLDKVTNKDSQT